MISIIVSTINSTYLKKFSENVANTIGVEFEIISIDKTINKYGICRAYNEGAGRSKFPYLCFVHEDVKFVTLNWGIKILEHFNSDDKIGLVGIAGNICKTKMSSTWPQSRLSNVETKRVNIIQHFKYSNKESQFFYVNPNHEIKSQVVNIDGVFMATKKEVWELNRFDEDLLSGFHAYDLDFCLQVGLSKEIFVIYDVLLEHFSEGNCDISCMMDYFKVHKKWKNMLPLIIEGHNWDINYNYKMSWIKLKQNIITLIKADKKYFFIFSNYCFLITLIDFKVFSFNWCQNVIRTWLEWNKYFFKFKLKKHLL